MLSQSAQSVLASYLLGKRSLPGKNERGYRNVAYQPRLTVRNANIHNLQDVTVTIPLGVMVGVTGMSGSGKSTLISNTLIPLLEQCFNEQETEEEEERQEDDTAQIFALGKLEGWE